MAAVCRIVRLLEKTQDHPFSDSRREMKALAGAEWVHFVHVTV